MRLPCRRCASYLCATPGATIRIQGYLADNKLPPPKDHHRALGIALLQGPRWGSFLMSAVLLHQTRVAAPDVFHQQPDVNFIQAFEKVDFPCTVHAQRVPFKGNQFRAETG